MLHSYENKTFRRRFWCKIAVTWFGLVIFINFQQDCVLRNAFAGHFCQYLLLFVRWLLTKNYLLFPWCTTIIFFVILIDGGVKNKIRMSNVDYGSIISIMLVCFFVFRFFRFFFEWIWDIVSLINIWKIKSDFKEEYLEFTEFLQLS